MSVIKTAAAALPTDYVKDTLVALNGDIVSTVAEAEYIGVIENGLLTLVRVATAPTLSQLGQDLQIAKRVEALPAVATTADLLTLTYGTAVDSGQVQSGDEVPVGKGATTKWFKFSGSSQADIANAAMWDEITPSAVAGSRYAGSSATMATAPTVVQGDSSQPIAAKDSFFLTADDVGTGSAAAPQFPRGWYIRNAANSAWIISGTDPAVSAASETVTLASLPADAWTAVASTMSNVRDSAITDASGNVITPSIMRRIVSGKLELQSTESLSNLSITLFN